MTGTQQLSDYLGALYELALQPNGWPRVLQRLLEWVGGCAAVLQHRQRACASDSPRMIRQYRAGAKLEWAAIENAQCEPLVSWARQRSGLDAGTLLALSDLSASTADGRHSELTLPGIPRLSDVLIAVIERNLHGDSIELLIARDLAQGCWSESPREALRLLMPHLQRVLRLSTTVPGPPGEKTGLIQRTLSAARLYAFTPAETRVLEALLEGRTIGSAARTLGIGESTVKTHLQHMFDKTDTRRQIDLVRLLGDPERSRARPALRADSDAAASRGQ